MTQDDIDAAWHALREAGYLRVLEGRPRRLADDVWSRIDLTERGRRAVGLWPSDRAADSLVDVLRQAADLTDDPEGRTRLRQAAGALLSVSRDILTDVGAAWVRAQTGL